jgi:hypothetical protein
MAFSTGRVKGGLQPGFYLHRSSGVAYSIQANGFVAYEGPQGREEQQLKYYVGSGVAGRSFLIDRGGFLFEAPVSWYATKRRWGASPGYQNDPQLLWSRPIEPECFLCHASQVNAVVGSVNRYADPPFGQPGIACERCHGPGSEHAAGRGAMINPAKLNPVRRDDVCKQCHLRGESRIAREGRHISEYRPGDLLSNYVAHFVFDEPPTPELKVTSHFEKLSISRCKQASGDRLWCGTCHDPHTLPADRAAWFRDKCLGCHEPHDCERGPDCAGCHMPKAPPLDAAHTVFTDHSIPRIPPKNGPRAARTWRLRPFSDRDAGDREIGLAYLELYQRTRDSRQKSEAERLLKAAVPGR